ncbi:hypothetical protein [uncultured Porphyromonas sp.]|jgi:hypothetical protein|uniref:hypothetical protein n=1 Tax=uncultured Porphyromonas sp. TaxID=159274 RepID=UPI00262834C7|nr:hypothetical protein [uncultured Porphyromonas sp.]
MSKKIGLKTSVAPPKAQTSNDDRRSLLQQQEKWLLNDRLKKNTRWRGLLAWWVIIVDSAWLAGVLVILILNKRCVQLSDPVLGALLCTTTANVLGLAFIVLKGLFQTEENRLSGLSLDDKD